MADWDKLNKELDSALDSMTPEEWIKWKNKNKMAKYISTKLFDGYSTCFRQWKAEGTHCKFLHGYAVSFRVWFEGELDHRNWVFDFGGMKRAKTTIHGMSPKDYFAYLLDHTTIISQDDPYMEHFKQMDMDGIIQLRIMDNVGCERFAEYLYKTINDFLFEETDGRVRATRVEVYEHERNSASYEE
jgi:6-pyruvoyltetrahydropterin/6-carboxytetrahydropterin synthase